MKVALWFLSLFGLAVATALMAGNNQGTVTLFWPPYRVDLALNMVVLVVLGVFVTLHVGLRALSALFDIPAQARQWRLQQRERGMLVAVLDALSHMAAGRFIRAQKAAEQALLLEQQVERSGNKPAYAFRLQALSHLLAAQSAQALQDKAGRERHFTLAMQAAREREAHETRDGLQMRAASWALADRDADAALGWLNALQVGAGRRTLALRLRLEAARLDGRAGQALETARLLSKHRAFSPEAAMGVLRSLALEWLAHTHDASQVAAAWQKLEDTERQMPEVACAAARQLMLRQGEAALARLWLSPVWDQMAKDSKRLNDAQQIALVQVLQMTFEYEAAGVDTDWLNRVEAAQRHQPQEVLFQYLAGSLCYHAHLWGKADQLLKAALPRLRSLALQAKAWGLLADMASAQSDQAAAATAWRKAAELSGRVNDGQSVVEKSKE